MTHLLMDSCEIFLLFCFAWLVGFSPLTFVLFWFCHSIYIRAQNGLESLMLPLSVSYM